MFCWHEFWESTQALFLKTLFLGNLRKENLKRDIKLNLIFSCNFFGQALGLAFWGVENLKFQISILNFDLSRSQ